jgi:hypothetical protein
MDSVDLTKSIGQWLAFEHAGEVRVALKLWEIFDN